MAFTIQNLGLFKSTGVSVPNVGGCNFWVYKLPAADTITGTSTYFSPAIASGQMKAGDVVYVYKTGGAVAALWRLLSDGKVGSITKV